MLMTLLNNLPGMAYRCRHDDGRRVMLLVSRGSLELTGFQPEEFVHEEGISYGALIHPEDKTAVSEEIELAIMEKRPFRCIYRLITASGQERWVLDQGEAIFAIDGSLSALEGFITDYTESMETLQQLEKKVADRTRKLSALYDILEVAADLNDLETTITNTLQRVLKAIKGNVGSIHLMDKTGKQLRLIAHQGMLPTVVSKISRISVQQNEWAGWVARHNQPLLIPKMNSDPRTMDLADDNTLAIYIGVPIVSREGMHGVLTVLSGDISRFTAKEEIELLVSVGEQIGVVVENARLRRQAEHLLVLEERNRLARDLHDSVTQSLYGITLFAEAGRALTESKDYERTGALFTDVLEVGQQALKEMRLLVHKLRPSILKKEGLIRALQHRLSAVEGRAGVKNHLIIEGTIKLSDEMEDALYHVAQEALNNALKHAMTQEVEVYLRQDADEFELKIVDDGKGFDPETAVYSGGLGLTSMRERVETLGGTIVYHSTIGQGSTVLARLPVTPVPVNGY